MENDIKEKIALIEHENSIREWEHKIRTLQCSIKCTNDFVNEMIRNYNGCSFEDDALHYKLDQNIQNWLFNSTYIKSQSNLHQSFTRKRETTCRPTLLSFLKLPICFSFSNPSLWPQGWWALLFDFYCIPAKLKFISMLLGLVIQYNS